jgi:hypothetical protein
MTYTKTDWTDEILDGLERFEILDDAGDPVAAVADLANCQIALATAITTPGTAVNAANLNKIEDALEQLDTDLALLLNPPTCRAYNDAAISIPNNIVTAVTFNSERWDTDAIHSTDTNTSRLTCKTAGLYQISGHIQFASNSTGIRSILIRLNGTTYIASQAGHQSSAAVAEFSVNTCYNLDVDDYVELVVYHNRGSALNVNSVANYTPEFGMTFLGKVA